MLEKQRIEWLDAFKGIAIILVVVGHLNTSTYIHNFIYGFHLFAFVFVSGILFKQRENVKELFKKDLKQIWFLFLLFSIIWLAFDYIYINALYSIRGIGDVPGGLSYIIKCAIALIFGNANLTGVSFGAVWYLVMLLALRITYYFLDKIVRQKEICLTGICACSFIIGIFMLNGNSTVPYYLSSVMSALLIFHIGRLSRCILYKIDSVKSLILLLIMILSLLLYGVSVYFAGAVNLGSNSYETPWTVFPNVLLGIVFFSCLSMLLVRFKPTKAFLTYYGKNSLSVMGWHSEIKICVLFLLSVIGIESAIINNIIVLLIILVLCIPLNFFTNKLITAINRSNDN